MRTTTNDKNAIKMSEQADTDFVRRESFYSGNVQGVGFRWTTSRTAQQYAVSGFVRNLADGRVQLVADGSKAEIEQFLADVEELMAENIASTESTTRTCTPAMRKEYPNFAIKH